MNYIGSKIRLSNFIYDTITGVAGKDLSGYIFCDLFAGTGTIGKIFQSKVKKIISNDSEYYSYVLNKAYPQGTDNSDTIYLIDELNELQGCPEFIFNEYSENGKSGRLYFSQANGQKIDAIRLKIEHWKNTGFICKRQYYFLLACLISGADKVANIASVYSVYLKYLKTTATKEMVIKPIEISTTEIQENKVFNEDSNSLIRKVKGDIYTLTHPIMGENMRFIIIC